MRRCLCFGLQMAGNHCYVDNGPPFLILLHPALGPLWDVTRQKVSCLFIHLFGRYI